MRQLKQEGTYLFIDPYDLSQKGFTVTINLNDVVKVAIQPGGLDIRHILTAVRFDGTYADLVGYQASRHPDEWAPLVQEFIQQLADPATALYDDSHGTTGPSAQQRIDRAQELHQEYTRMAETLTIPDNRNTNPQVYDSNTVRLFGQFYSSVVPTGTQKDLSFRLKDCLGILNLISNFLLYMEPTAPAGAASREMER